MEYRVSFKTNIDHYQKPCWPTNIKVPPRIGEQVEVVNYWIAHYRSQKLPTTLKVVNVVWGEYGVTCELWYSKNDVEAAKLSGVSLL